MKELLHSLLMQAWQQLHAEGLLSDVMQERIEITLTRDAKHGDYASNLSLILAREAALKPRELAQKICEAIPRHADVQKVEIAGPGFINFTLQDSAKMGVIDEILKDADQYGRCPPGSRHRILIEYVSANPTGPLHVGHGRGAALGSCLIRILSAAGHPVESEYFINDAGRQMQILAISVWLRYLELCGKPFAFPVNAYQGDYILDIAAELHREQQDRWQTDLGTFQDNAPPKEAPSEVQDTWLDALIQHAREFLGDDDWALITQTARATLLERIRRDLDAFGAPFDHWRSEQELLDGNQVEGTLNQLQDAGHLYEKEGALWFRSSAFGDEKDRVVRRSNGQWTYFASDIAYHAEKLSRGFDSVINIWGSDHHGYAARIRGAIRALGADDQCLEIILVQFANLRRGDKKLTMSTRSGEFIPLQALQREVGRDATRFFYVMRGSAQHLDFDLELATRQTADNPVYYVQYAHARICRLLEKAGETEATVVPCDLSGLTEKGEQALQKIVTQYPDIVTHAAAEREPHHLTHYLRELAGEFHAYYNATPVLVDDMSVRQARLRLALAVRQVLRNGLDLLGINAPTSL